MWNLSAPSGLASVSSQHRGSVAAPGQCRCSGYPCVLITSYIPRSSLHCAGLNISLSLPRPAGSADATCESTL
ncbi:hypothetical protein FKM82_029021 [Ascaphus truei]